MIKKPELNAATLRGMCLQGRRGKLLDTCPRYHKNEVEEKASGSTIPIDERQRRTKKGKASDEKKKKPNG